MAVHTAICTLSRLLSRYHHYLNLSLPVHVTYVTVSHLYATSKVCKGLTLTQNQFLRIQTSIMYSRSKVACDEIDNVGRSI